MMASVIVEKGKIMTNAEKFVHLFGLYATELWSKSEKDFLIWLNAEYKNIHDVNIGELIDRQAAIDAWKEDFKGFVNSLDMPRDDYKGIMEYIDELPSVNLDLQEWQKIFLANYRPHGKWIPHQSKYGHEGEMVYTCDCCGHNVGFHKENFCPNCGSYNGGNIGG